MLIFERIFKYYDEVFLFIDPPYFNADQDKFYEHSFIKNDHTRLTEALKKNGHKFNFLMTYDNSQEVWDMYDASQQCLLTLLVRVFF